MQMPPKRPELIHHGLEPVDERFKLSVDTMSYTEKFLFSQAISLKRIADSLEKLTNGSGFEAIIDKIAKHPINDYGEGLGDAIQNGMARGLQGINTHELRR